MRRRLILFCAALAGAAYIGWPLYTAWSIKEAVATGDSAYLAEHIEWTPVKATLKESMADMVLEAAAGEHDAALKPKRQGLWNSFKAYYGRSMVDQMVERYANPTDLPRLFSYGRTVRRSVLGRIDPDVGLPLLARISNSWARIDRAAFITPLRFEIDMRDKFDPSRVYAGVLELKDWRWRVTELRVFQRPPRTPTTAPTVGPPTGVSNIDATARLAAR